MNWDEVVRLVQDVAEIDEAQILMELFSKNIPGVVVVNGVIEILADYEVVAPEHNWDTSVSALKTVVEKLIPGMEVPEIPHIDLPPHVENEAWIVDWPSDRIEKSLFDALKRARVLLDAYLSLDYKYWHGRNIRRLEVI